MILDISHYQGSIDWDKLAPELDFVILRATVGMAKDNRYIEYSDNCVARGIPFGAYHYLKASNEETALEEAAFFYKTASPQGPLFYVMDTEHDNQTADNSSVIFRAFIGYLRGKGVKKAGVYANRKYPYIKNDLDIVDFVWVPRYGKDTGYPDAENYPPKYPCDLWQYTSKGKAPGVRGYVDMNQLYSDKTLEWFTSEEKEETHMAVMIGSARGDENGKAHGGKAGDQTGREVSTQNWYKHSKGWVLLRPKDPKKAAKIAQAMRAACDNPNIGYDQYQNGTLWNEVKDKGYDPAKASKPCETDCARLVRVCCAYAGIMAKDFYTATEAKYLMDTGEFVKLTASKYVNQEDYLGVGDILVTKTKGHTVVVLSNGSKYDGEAEEAKRELGDRILRDGDYGSDVQELQARLKAAGYDPGEIDGEYGPNTEAAVKALQEDAGIAVDGEFGPDSLKALEALEVDDEPVAVTTATVVNCTSLWIRAGASTNDTALTKIPVGTVVPVYQKGEEWSKVAYNGVTGYSMNAYLQFADEGGEAETPTKPEHPVETPEEEPAEGDVVISGGNAFIRTGPGTQYDKAGVAKNGERYAYANPDEWIPVLINGEIRWISGKYAKKK